MPEEDERREAPSDGAAASAGAAAAAGTDAETDTSATNRAGAAAERSPGSPGPQSATEVPGILDGLSPWERDYRIATLAAIERHVREEGPHEAKPDPRRARQFMPFAALKGYGDLTREREDEAALDEE